MPKAKSNTSKAKPTTPKAKSATPRTKSQRERTETTRRREARENEEADKREREGLKAATEARKARRAEAADDDLLVEREGDSPDLSKLRALAMQLDAENLRMQAQLERRSKASKKSPLIAEPVNKGDVGVSLIRTYIGKDGEEHDAEWSMMKHDWRCLISSAGLNLHKTWSKQDLDRLNTLIHAAEETHLVMKIFEAHWGVLYCLQESFNNMHYYQRKRSRSIAHSSHPNTTPNSSDDSDDPEARARKAVLRKAALQRSVQRHAAYRKAADEQEAKKSNRMEVAEPPFNDGETEIEELSEDLREHLKRTEIGVSASSDLLSKSNTEARGPTTPSNKKNSKSTPLAKSSKPRPVIYLKHGHGPKGKQGTSATKLT